MNSPGLNRTSRNLQVNSDSGVLNLQQSHVKFEPPNKKVSVFFDECNREIISVISAFQPQTDPSSSAQSSSPSHSNKTKVLFQATDRRMKIEFLLPISKRILSIKLNSARCVLAYHVEKSIIEFINVTRKVDENGAVVYALEDKRYVQTSRAKNSKLFGFIWTGPMELIMITDISIEYYHVDPSRRRLKHIKSFQSTTNWFVYQPSVINNAKHYLDNEILSDGEVEKSINNYNYSILIVSTGSLGYSMQPYMFQSEQVFRLQKFDVDNSNWQQGNDQKLELFERSITIASIYNQVRLLVLQHESLNVKSRGAQILVYTIDRESGHTTKTHTLDLDVNGRFAINIIDNLVVAHDQPSKSSFIFDIMIDSTEKSDCPKHFVSLIGGQSIKAATPRQEDSSCDNIRESKAKPSTEMYSLNWVFFQPNFIIDAKMGLLSTLHLDLNTIRESIMKDSLILLNFLAHRKHSEQIILNECKDIVCKSYNQLNDNTKVSHGSSLADVSAAFDILSKLVISAPELRVKKGEAKQTSGRTVTKARQAPFLEEYGARLAQEDIYREVLKQLTKELEDLGPAQLHFVKSTLMELIFAIRKLDKNVDFCIYEQLFHCLSRNKRYYQIVQMIRSDIFKDSKQLACLLLSIRDQYAPAAQLGLDMLQRLDCLTDLIESLNLAPILSPRTTSSQATSETTSRLSVALHQSLETDTVNS